jgi:8-oxo-dGTP pyrophosphatase MutT (NUDIX family)
MYSLAVPGLPRRGNACTEDRTMDGRSNSPEPEGLRVPRRLYRAVPLGELTRRLIEAGLDREPLADSGAGAMEAAGGGEHALVTVFAREAERDGIAFRPADGMWTPSAPLEPHLLACRDDDALRALRAKRKRSAGGLVVSSLEDPRVMLLFRRHGDATAWKLPKGGVERGESLKAAARREVAEEAGLTRLRVVGYLGRMQYFKPHPKRGLSEKTVHVFLMLSLDGETGISPREGERFVSCEWLRPEEAVHRVTQPQARRLIRRVVKRSAESGVRSPE